MDKLMSFFLYFLGQLTPTDANRLHLVLLD